MWKEKPKLYLELYKQKNSKMNRPDKTFNELVDTWDRAVRYARKRLPDASLHPTPEYKVSILADFWPMRGDMDTTQDAQYITVVFEKKYENGKLIWSEKK